jgi:hypothetical protein
MAYKPFTRKKTTSDSPFNMGAEHKINNSPLYQAGKKIDPPKKGKHIETTMEGEKAQKEWGNSSVVKDGQNEILGTNVNKRTGEASAKQFKREYKEVGPNTHIVGDDGKTIYSGRTTDEKTQKAIAESKKKEKYVMEDRTRNANVTNVLKGRKADLTEEDKATKVGVGYAKYTK